MIARTVRLLAALLLVNGILVGPLWLGRGEEPVPLFALEAAFVAGLFLLLPARPWTRRLALGTAAAVVLLGLLGLADTAVQVSLARPLNLYLDYPLSRAVVNLVAGTFGTPVALVLFLVLGVGVAGLAWLVAYLLAPDWGGRAGPPRSGSSGWPAQLVGAALTLPLVLVLLDPWMPTGVRPAIAGVSPSIGTPVVGLIVDQVARVGETLTVRDEFMIELQEAPQDYSQVEGLLSRLEGVDVLLAFVESYGISALDDERYASTMLPRLRDLEERVGDAGLHIASGTLIAPTQGGESWYSHGSFLSGLWLGDQIRYDLMLASGRETLVDDFRRVGHRTVVVMPAITYAWPDGDRFGYDEIYARPDIPYAGPSLNWVTMPDQFTWTFIEREIRGNDALPGGERSSSDAPVFVEVGLISSHAPWTPILPVLEDWESVGDGRVFQEWAGAGERPETLWLDTDRVREHYALALNYALDALTGYAERFVDGRTLLIALGDHQPAPLITGDGVSWSVPVHVISGDPALIQPFLDWGFVSGAMPGRTFQDRGMDYFRDWFVHAFSGPGGS